MQVDHEMVPRNHCHDFPVARGSILKQNGITRQRSRGEYVGREISRFPFNQSIFTEFVEPRNNGFQSRRESEKFQRFFSVIDEDE